MRQFAPDHPPQYLDNSPPISGQFTPEEENDKTTAYEIVFSDIGGGIFGGEFPGYLRDSSTLVAPERSLDYMRVTCLPNFTQRFYFDCSLIFLPKLETTCILNLIDELRIVRKE